MEDELICNRIMGEISANLQGNGTNTIKNCLTNDVRELIRIPMFSPSRSLLLRRLVLIECELR